MRTAYRINVLCVSASIIPAILVVLIVPNLLKYVIVTAFKNRGCYSRNSWALTGPRDYMATTLHCQTQTNMEQPSDD